MNKQPASYTLLLVEDDESLLFVVRENLEWNGYKVLSANNTKTALELLNSKTEKIDAALVDIMLGDGDGYQLAEHITNKLPGLPFIFLTALGQKEERIKGLRAGADDYLTKPFSIEELLLRVKIILRRNHKKMDLVQIVKIGDYQYNAEDLLLSIHGQSRQLTRREADLLNYLLDRQGRLVSREDILVAIWGENDYFKGRSLDVFITRLRNYLKEDPKVKITNVHSAGFRLDMP